MVDLGDLMDVADHDPHEQRLLATLERMSIEEVREVAAEAVRYAAWARPMTEPLYWHDDTSED